MSDYSLETGDYGSEEEYQIAVCSQMIKRLQEEIRKLQSNVPFICTECKHHNIVKNTTLHLYEYYVYPYSCAGGDYYREEKYARIQCESCKTFLQFDLITLDIPRQLFKNIEVHQQKV